MLKDKVAVCVISTNDNYVYKAIITLLSVKEKNEENKNYEYFVCGNINEKYKKIIEGYNIRVLEINLDNIFGDTRKFRWPNECFWICAIPEALYKKGFAHSLVLDGDIFCIRKVPMNVIEEVEEIAFATGTKVQASNENEYELIKKIFPEKKDIEGLWMNSGTIVYNNRNLARKNFKEEFIKSYRDLSKITYFEEDELVFYFLKIKELFKFCYIGVEWNNFFQDTFPENKIIFLHLQYKPWRYGFLQRKEVPYAYPNYLGAQEHQKRRIKYKELYINFCKKTYGSKFYWYYIGDFIPIKEIIIQYLPRLLDFFKLRKTVREFLAKK